MKQNQISTLPTLQPTRYENLFDVIEQTLKGKKYYVYNLLNAMTLPPSIDTQYLDTYTCNRKIPWTTLAYELYKNTDLWFIICLLNKDTVNKFYASPGEVITYLKPDYIPSVTAKLNE